MQSSHPKFAIASLSLGSYVHHNLPTKIRVASNLGYQGIEIFLPDFEAFVKEVRQGQHGSLFHGTLPQSQRDLERTCATALASLCKSSNLSIPIIQPLRNFENFTSQEQLDHALDEAERLFDLMPYFDTDLLLVCSNFIEGPHPVNSGAMTMQAYLDAQVSAFNLLGARARKYNVRVGYEPLAWGTVIDRWENVWDVVRRVDLPNVGVILDSFNTLGNQYADPSTLSSLRADATLASIQSNMDFLKATIPASKIFFYQLGDAHRPLSPIPDSPDAPARMIWSRASRLFPFDDPNPPPAFNNTEDRKIWTQKHTGFLPVASMTRALYEAGYRDWWSLEVFNTSLLEADAGCPHRHGERGIFGLRTLWENISRPDEAGLRGQIERLVTPPLEIGGGEETESDSSELRSIEGSISETPVTIVETVDLGTPGWASFFRKIRMIGFDYTLMRSPRRTT